MNLHFFGRKVLPENKRRRKKEKGRKVRPRATVSEAVQWRG
jgi:hypothetical protein